MWYSITMSRLYVGDCHPDDREATPEEIAAYEDDLADKEKKVLLSVARESREIALNRLTGHYIDAEIANDAVAKAAILACKASLKNMFLDPRVTNAVNGEVKAAAFAVWAEIQTALYVASPATYVAFRGLDAL